jgi:hypothetical protein
MTLKRHSSDSAQYLTSRCIWSGNLPVGDWLHTILHRLFGKVIETHDDGLRDTVHPSEAEEMGQQFTFSSDWVGSLTVLCHPQGRGRFEKRCVAGSARLYRP